MLASNREVAGQTIADVLVQLRCEKCGGRPIRVALEEDAAATSPDRMGALCAADPVPYDRPSSMLRTISRTVLRTALIPRLTSAPRD